MKQTVEEASCIHWSESTYKEDAELAYDKHECIAVTALVRHISLRAFKAGAEWQAKQSPWISVKERLPEVGELVLCRMVSNGAIVSGFIEPVKGCQPIVSTLPNFEFEDYSDYVCDMWMPIPTFDQIFEANKDVLQRLK